MRKTGDPIYDYEMYSMEQEKQLQKLPRCSECDEPIQSEHCYEINDELICPKCMESNHKKWVEDYVQ